MDEANDLATLLGYVILETGPVLISQQTIDEGMPEDAYGVVVEQTQEGYLVFITNRAEDSHEPTE